MQLPWQLVVYFETLVFGFLSFLFTRTRTMWCSLLIFFFFRPFFIWLFLLPLPLAYRLSSLTLRRLNLLAFFSDRTFTRLVLALWYHLRYCLLLITSSPNCCFGVHSQFLYLVPFIAQSLPSLASQSTQTTMKLLHFRLLSLTLAVILFCMASIARAASMLNSCIIASLRTNTFFSYWRH